MDYESIMFKKDTSGWFKFFGLYTYTFSRVAYAYLGSFLSKCIELSMFKKALLSLGLVIMLLSFKTRYPRIYWRSIDEVAGTRHIFGLASCLR